jgi:predicted dehydrogenase
VSDKVLKAAIVGLGRIGADCGPSGEGASRIDSHAHAYSDCPLTEIVAGCDTDPTTRERFTERWGVTEVYEDSLEMIHQARPHLLSICLPPNARRPLLEALPDTPWVKGVLLEKPFAANMEEADWIMGLSRSIKAKIVVNHVRRFPPVYRQLATQVKEGALGRIQHVGVKYTRGVTNNGGHVFDLLRMFFGEPEGLEVLGLSDTVLANDPSLDIRVLYKEGFEVWVKALSGNAFNIFDVDIIGTEGRLLLGDLGHNMLFYRVRDMRPQHWFNQLVADGELKTTGLVDAIRHAVANLVESVQSDGTPACTQADGRAALELSTRSVALLEP